METITKEMQDSITPRKALDLMIEGNNRFIKNEGYKRDLLKQASDTATSQFPFAVTLSCIDSRTSMELIFDQGIGDIFSTRIAGNIINEDILGSMEFACKLAGSKLIVVLGHSSCGAVKGACDSAEMGNLTVLLDKIKPAINEEKTEKETRDSSNKVFVEKVTKINVAMTVQNIMEKSPVLKEMIESGAVGIVGGVHDLATGKVNFHEETLILK
jgi:carbonic anhydrase